MTENTIPASKRMLLVEDDPDYTNLLKLNLLSEKQPSFEVEVATNLGSALQILCEKKFDLILLDLGLPDSNGIATFEKLASVIKDVPFVILSGMDDDALALEAVKRGAQDYVVKGNVDRKVLFRILNYAIERHHQKKQFEELNKRLEQLSSLDPLTQLLNRRGLQRVLSRELQVSAREGSNLVVILLDLDNFKPINDSFGHAVGDIVLQEIAKILKNTIRLEDYVSRIGGDEFIILLPDTRSAEAARFCERLRLAISRTPAMSLSGQEIRITASFGVINVTKRNLSIEELLEQTHGALAKSKRLGKNRVSFEDGKEEKTENVIEQLKSGRCFHAVKQTIWDLSEEKTVGYEFLSRSTIPGFEMPEEFLNFSREGNILLAVDHHCLETTMAASYKVPAAYEKHLNLFPSTLAGLQTEQFDRLFPPTSLCGSYCVEISEQQILGDPSYLVPAITEFKKRGICIAIDDVGFGRSCLESLIILQPDVIKLDKGIIRDVAHDKGRREVLRRLLHVVGSLDTKIIAEGIENREDLEALKELGVQYGQGYYWGMPA
ncbi:MAG TPA: diguanylate cyclase [Candidatus Omnitrophota bacterium]|nr:diguanylate cyclase [Candidatus Omnitrophota bacterium]